MGVKEFFEEANQQHLFKHWERLSQIQRDELLQNLNAIAKARNPNQLIKDCQDAIQLAVKNSNSPGNVEPLPSSSSVSIIGKPELRKKYEALGLNAIARGEVAVILMAGGQGTRLGSSLPKGCYDIGLPSRKSLFQIQAEKLRRLQEIAKSSSPIPWYIMTSKSTARTTVDFFKKHNYFGLQSSQVVFFNQGTLPAFDTDGKNMLLNDPTHLVESPDGNGGLYRAMKENRILQDLDFRGIKHLYMYCVDNVLSKIADPVFIGFAIDHKFDLATKAVRKRTANESVGLIATREGKPCVIEYSEIPKALAEEKDLQGLLKFRAANIVNHYYSVDLLKKELINWCRDIPYHAAKKKIPFYDNEKDQFYKPDQPNGIKLEQFIFDIFPFVSSEKFGCLEVDRNDEFAPLKNGPNSEVDNPETSRKAYLELGTSWLKNAGAIVRDGVLVEVSSSLSFAGENLEQFKDHSFDVHNTVLN